MAHRICHLTPIHPIFQSGVCLALCLYGATLLAAPTNNTTTTEASDRLFQEGKELLVAERYAEACEKLAKSYRLEASGGTILYLGACHKAEGKSLIAWSELQEAARIARLDARTDRESAALKLLDELKDTCPKISLDLGTATASISGLELSIDGVPIPREHWSGGIPANPGAHTVAVSAPGYIAERKTVNVDSVATTHVVHIPKLWGVLEVLFDIDPSAPDVSAKAEYGKAHSQAGRPPSSPLQSQHPVSRVGKFAIGAAFSGLGVLGLIVGPILGVHASNLKEAASAYCDNLSNCTNKGYALHKDASTYSDVSAALLIGGTIAATAGGITWVLIATNPPRPAETASAPLKLSFQAGSRGVFLSGQF